MGRADSCIERGCGHPNREEVDPLNSEPAPRLKAFWFLLITLGIGLSLLLLFATLQNRPLDLDALRFFPAEMLERGRRFSREARLAATLSTLASFALMLALCFSATGSRLLAWLERLGRGRHWRELFWVSSGVILLTWLVDLPFAYYLGHLHEKAYGLSRMTSSGWMGEHLQGLLTEMLTSLLYWLPLYWLIRRSNRYWWIPASLLTAGFGLLLASLYPVVLLPLSAEVRPVRDPQVIAMIQRLAERTGVEVSAVKEIRMSDKSARLNAMVTGLGPTRQVVLYNTLMERMTPAEVEVVVAHELAHAVHRDLVTGWAVSSGLSAISLALAAWMLRAMRRVAPLDLPAVHAARGLALLILFFSLFDMAADPALNAVSRRAEVRADQYALTITQNPRAVVSSFQKLAAANPSDVAPHPVVELLSHSHPSILNRIRAALRGVY